MIILGIDPGYALTGFGVIESRGPRLTLLEYGTISTRAGVPFPERLLRIDQELGSLLARHAPEVAAIEELFFYRNVTTAIGAAQGRGAAVVAMARAGIPVVEYTPMQVKQAVTGYGKADKVQVQQMVRLLLAMSEPPKPDDAADALAIAICHAHVSGGIPRQGR